MPDTRTFRLLFVGTLVTGIVAVLLWSAWLFRPQRDETIRAALKNHSRPAIWWPPSWRAEFGAVAPFLDGLQSGKFKDLTDEQIVMFKSFGGGRNAFWGMAQTLREQDEFSRDLTLVFLSACDFNYQGWDQEIEDFLAVLRDIADDEFPYRYAANVPIQIAAISKSALPQLVRSLDLAFARKAKMDGLSDSGALVHHRPSPAQPVYEMVSALGKLGPDAKEAVPVLTKILAHEKRRLSNPGERRIIDHEYFRRVYNTVYESLSLIDPEALQAAVE